MKKRKKRAKAPPQITLGGQIGLKVWKRYIIPLVRDGRKSTREIGALLGVSHMTVNRWRNAYL